VSSARYRFGPFELDTAAYRLRNGADDIDLTPKAFEVLRRLVEQPQGLLSKEEIFRTVWADVIVTDNALTQVISELRQALGDSATAPRYVQTVARKGYRFISPVEAIEAASRALAAVAGLPAPSSDAHTVAVFDFTNVTNDPETAWLSVGLAESLVTDLRGLNFRLVDRTRILEVVRDGTAPLEAARRLGADLVVTGSVQRVGDRLRITARLTDAASGEVKSDARADGRREDVFHLQDAVGFDLGKGLGLRVMTPKPQARMTANLDAYRAAVEGRILLESLDAAAIPQAVERFTRAMRLDAAYAPAYVGLANARCWQHERSRSSMDPPAHLLDAAIEDARRAIELDPTYPEAHGTLSFVLACAGRREEARIEATRAVTLEPDQWTHYFRLANATWGSERLNALERTLALYPEFPFAHFQVAMVHIARHALHDAACAVTDGITVLQRHESETQRFPASGLYFLAGLLALARGDARGALAEFDRERAAPAGHVYSAEFAAAAGWGRGFALLALGSAADAVAAFEGVIEDDSSGRASLGLALAGRADAGFASAERLAAHHRSAGRPGHAVMIAAGIMSVRADITGASQLLATALAAAPPGHFGWMLAIDPVFAPLWSSAEGRQILTAVRERAR
jgi:DNA-binding winged helix-turn-helix (wHTH) protein/tetratricopeptide (TPR) repeat protein